MAVKIAGLRGLKDAVKKPKARALEPSVRRSRVVTGGRGNGRSDRRSELPQGTGLEGMSQRGKTGDSRPKVPLGKMCSDRLGDFARVRRVARRTRWRSTLTSAFRGDRHRDSFARVRGGSPPAPPSVSRYLHVQQSQRAQGSPMRSRSLAEQAAYDIGTIGQIDHGKTT